MGTIIAPTSPWTFDSTTDGNGKAISGTVTFSGAWTGTNALTGGTFHRDAGCVFTKVVIGAINQDGTYPAGTKVIDVSGVNGDQVFSQAQLHAVGLDTVADILTAPQTTFAR
jgi:hypothetical protein